MAKAVVPPSKAPADKGHHVVLNFPVANVKEQSIKVELKDDSENQGASASVTVSFETFSPTKRYEKVLELPDSVTLRQWTKNVSSKNLSIILLKASHAPPPSPKSQSLPIAAPSSPELLPSAAAPPLIEKEQPAKRDVASKAAEKEKPAEHSEDDEEEEHVEANGQEGPAASGKKKKKNKPRKKGKNASKVGDEEDDVQVVDEVLVAATAEVDRVLAKLQDARSRLQSPKKELDAAEASEAKAAQKTQQLEAELLKWEAHYKAEIRKWQAEQKTAAARREDCKHRLVEAQGLVESLEAEAERNRTLVREAEAKGKEHARAAAEIEEERKQELEREAQAEKKQDQEERRKRAEEERQRVSEEKKRKEAERKQNASRREVERKLQEEEEERSKAQRKGKAAPPTGMTADMKNFPGGMHNFKEMAEQMKQNPAMLDEMMKRNPGMLDEMMKEQKSAKAPGAAPKSPAKVEPWKGPLIEEIESVPETNGKPPYRAAVVHDASEAAAAGWVIEEGQDGAGSSWMLDLAVPSIASLAEVNLDIGGDAILLTPVDGGPPVARCMVPADANADEASAKWSKKKRALTIRMPRVV